MVIDTAEVEMEKWRLLKLLENERCIFPPERELLNSLSYRPSAGMNLVNGSNNLELNSIYINLS